jgi:hypothetical protein
VDKPVGHGFDEAAVEAARKLVFKPAMRGDKPIPVKIKFKYHFEPPRAAVGGRVLSDKGERPIAGANVTVTGADGHSFAATTGADGSWRITDLPFGKYHVEVAASGYSPRAADEELAPGEETNVVDRLAPTAPATAPTPTAPGEPETEEIEVHGTRPPREVTKRTLEQREINRIPGTGGDALRSLQNLPGVARPPGLAGLLIVRGSNPEDTQIFVDGTYIPIVYHFGGLSSVVPTEALDRIDFYPGNFSAQYGRAMGGIVDVGLRDPKKDKLHGLAQADLIDTRILAEGPIGKTGWNVLVAGRRSWVDVWLKPVLERTGASVSTAPVYYDYQAIVQRDLDKHSSLRFAAFGSDDRLDILIKSANASDPSIAGGISTHTGFWRVQGRYTNRFSKETEFRLTSAAGEDYVDFSLGDNYFKLTSWPITTRVELAQKLEPRLTMNVGMDIFYAPYTVDVRFPPFPKPGEPPGGPFLSRPPVETHDTDSIYRPAMYTEFEATPWRGGRIVPGIRLDYAKDTRAWDLQPRVTVRQDITQGFPRTTAKGGVGVYAQPPQPQETNPVFGQLGLVSNRALHYGLGVEREFTRNIEASLEGFYKELDYLVSNGHGNGGTGLIYGAETLIRYKPDERFFGWLAYTLSRSLRRDYPGAPLRESTFDQTHILTVLGSYRLGRGWEIGARYRLVSGNLYTPNTYGFFDENGSTYLALNGYPPNSSRMPLFHQLDMRVDKTWVLGRGTIGAYLDVQNVYNQGNVEGVSYNFNYTQSTYATGLPFIPSLGLRLEM